MADKELFNELGIKESDIETPEDLKRLIKKLRAVGALESVVDRNLERFRSRVGLNREQAEDLKNEVYFIKKQRETDTMEDLNKKLNISSKRQEIEVSGKVLSKNEQQMKKNKEKVIKRINDILTKTNKDNMGGRYRNYIKGGKVAKRAQKTNNTRYPAVQTPNYNMIDPQTGMMHINASPSGYDLEQSMYPKGHMVQLNYDKTLKGAGPYGNYLNYEGAGGNVSIASHIGAGGYPDMQGTGGMDYVPIGSGGVDRMAGTGRKRKQRADKGKPRKQNQWQQMVKAVANEYGLPYNKALKKASELKGAGYVLEDFM